MSTTTSDAAPPPAVQRLALGAMALCLAVMACAVFVNVVLRYGFASGVAAAYPLGEHLAFTSLLLPLRDKPPALRAMSRLIHALVVAAAGLVAWGAWQQVVVGLDGKSPVIGYSMALLPLPALLCTAVICVLGAFKLVRGDLVALTHEAETE